MSRNLKIRNLGVGPIALALALSTSIVTFGCTTDRTLGNGDPVVTPGVRTTPTSNVGGSESAPSNPPMTSSSGSQMHSAPAPISAAEAAALLVDSLPRVRVLGPSSPDAADRGYASEGVVTGQFVNPALETNPQLTVNSSVSSQPVAAITSGAGGVATTGGVLVGGTAGALVAGVGSAGPATVSGLSNGPLINGALAPVVTNVSSAPVATSGLGVGGNSSAFVPANGAMTPTTSGLGVSGTTSTTLSPTTTSLRNPTPTTAAAPAITPTTASRTATATRRLNTRSTTTSSSGDVRIVRDANGHAVVTNSNPE